MSEDIYFGIKFLSWSQASGGGFSYQRTTASTLPVTLQSFTGAIVNNNAVITWTTAAELNNKYFEVQHGTDGENFLPLGKVDASQNGENVHKYGFIHSNLSAGKHYYRLGQYDIDGAVTYSQIIKINSQGTERLQVSPNPATTFISLDLPSLTGLEYTISFSTGQIVKRGILSDSNISVREFPSGFYRLTVKTRQGRMIVTSFLKK